MRTQAEWQAHDVAPDGLAQGYRHPDYARSLAEFGTPRPLPACGGWLLERPIPGSDAGDAMGPYPLFACNDWSGLASDLAALTPDLVSVALVVDPFGGFREADLKRCFSDVVVPFKEHYVTNLTRPRRQIVSSHHRRNARKAMGHIDVHRCKHPVDYLDDWVRLYDRLIKRHQIEGLRRFSRRAFAQQFQVPGMVAFRAVHHNETVAMLLWYEMGEVAYYHLGASSQRGYQFGATFALFWEAISFFADCGLRWLNLGAGAGTQDGHDDGLSRFKRGWATETRTAYFCGRILDPVKYQQISRQKGRNLSSYFPAYREGEFV